MKNKKKPETKESSEFREMVAKLEVDLQATSRILVLLFLIMVFLKYFMKTNIPFGLVIMSIFWLLLYVLVWLSQVKKRKSIKELQNFYLFYNGLDLLLITGVIHYTGGAEWIGILFYALSVTVAGLILPRKKAIFLAGLALFFYSALMILEALAVIPHEKMFQSDLPLYQSPNFIIAQVLVVGAILFFLVDTTGEHYAFLKQKQVQLEKERQKAVEAYEKSKEGEKILEVRVQARTRELETVLKKQEELIKERTKELRDKIDDMQKFERLVVGRELKMIELKKELERLKEKP